MGATVELRSLEVEYPGFRLGPVSWQVEAGEHVALVGPNGAGKTTMLRAVAGLLDGYGGSVRVQGREVLEVGPAVRLEVGILHERLMGFGWMTVEEHLALMADVFTTWDADYAESLRDQFGVPRRTKLANLSKGNEVKLSFISAEAFRPPLLLLDEPTSGIDPVMRREILDRVRASAAEGNGRTVIFSTHILEDVEDVADRVVFLRDGRIRDDVPLARIREEAAGDSLTRVLYRRMTDA